MRLALNEERRSRDQLLGELDQNRDAIRQQALLSERESRCNLSSSSFKPREQEAPTLQQQQANLQQQFAAAQTNIQTLNQQLQSTSTEAVALEGKTRGDGGRSAESRPTRPPRCSSNSRNSPRATRWC